jgi:putative tricarboxylic transport membrane protein
MRTADIVVASLLLGLGVLVLRDSVRMGIGWGSDGPEGGFVPFWLAAILIFSCAIIIAHAARRTSDKRFVTGKQIARVLQVLAPAAAMIVLTPYLGLYVATVLYMSAYMRWGGRHSWKFSIALPLSFAVLLFLVFERWFLVPLPKGPLEAWLGY